MTLPIYLAAHLAFGALMAFAMRRRMQAEGELIAIPMLFAIVPVCLLTVPLGTALLRFSGGWFLHG